MLQPFEIRDLHGPEKPSASRPVPRRGLVQISAADYDDLAVNHPRARLTYVDVDEEDDEGDTITVGSSLELSQRLDEPVDAGTRLGSIDLSLDEPAPMHIFDIRRSNSVTELWKRFEYGEKTPHLDDLKNSDPGAATKFAVDTKEEDGPAPANVSATAAPGDDSQPLLAAFEAELAGILDAAEPSEHRAPRPESPPVVEPSMRTPHPIEALAAQVLHHLVNGASLVQSELSSRLPELQRQLHHVQRSVPENVGMSLQTLLATLEAHIRTALHNLPDNGRQFAEEAINAGRPVAENAADNFRVMASELNEVGRTLFAAFESEFGRSASSGSATASSGPNTSPPGPAPEVTTSNNGPAASGMGEAPTVAVPARENEPKASDQLKLPNPEPSTQHPMSSSSENAGQSAQSQTHPSNNLGASGHSGFPYNFPYHRPHYIHSHPSQPPFASACPQPMPRWAPPPSWTPFQPYPPPSYPNTFQAYRPPPPPPPPSFDPSALFGWPHLAPGRRFHASRHPTNPSSRNTNEASAAPTANAPSRNTNTQTGSSANKTLFIGNVGFNVTEKMIQEVFASKGFIVKVDLPLDAASGKHAGFGYLHFPSIHPAMAAMEALQGAHIDGHSINIEFSDHSPIESIQTSQSSQNNGSSSVGGTQQSISLNGSDKTGIATTRQGPTPGNQSSSISAGAEQPSSNGHISQQEHSSSNGRRKSVTFQEPNSTATTTKVEGRDASVKPGNAQTGSTALLDSITDDPAFAARFPSLLPSDSPQRHATGSGQEKPAGLSPELEMARFPPVSQLEAQLLAQRQGRATGPEAANEQEQYHERSSIHSIPSHPAPQAFPQRSRTVSGAHGVHDLEHRPGVSRSINYGRQHSKGDAGHGLRRANTMVFARPGVNQPGSFDRLPSEDSHGTRLRRRASERHCLRPHHASETDTWARLDRRERTRNLHPERIPGSFPGGETSQNQAPISHGVCNSKKQEDKMDSCVSALVGMGYGTERDGGHSRMAVYAAAADGSLPDAIEMIEDERKVYARHGRQ
ncbi:hypothetical protein NUU61_004945 [Penicillium alfredii]|uniref:RRM domain-containing protein n=1 Tax=Penicillium alfredii TaxID=1506179 RepID=A0A9W9F8M1_9EURO|nr:uncharacterized protein NUU61_004945 [Penicillium alfredii]KAJ5095589.1 hypothetical protein NUU61_004945 [Penicillium alfredii]